MREPNANVSQQNDIPLSVIGGYLGAGKTTLLNHLLRNKEGRRYAVLVNDFGSLNIDAGLIESQQDNVIRLDNGCLCCTLVTGLAETLNQVRQMDPWPEHVVIEASGVADPIRIGHYAYVAPFRPEAVLVVADAETLRVKGEDRFVGESVVRQLRGADLVLLNKTDLLEPSELQLVHAWIQQKAPEARVVETQFGQISPALLHGHRSQSPLDFGPEHAVHRSWSLQWSHALDRRAVEDCLNSWPETVLRAKGFLFLKDDPERRYLLQKVGKRCSLAPDREWNQTPQSEVVVIALLEQLDGAQLLSLIHI